MADLGAPSVFAIVRAEECCVCMCMRTCVCACACLFGLEGDTAGAVTVPADSSCVPHLKKKKEKKSCVFQEGEPHKCLSSYLFIYFSVKLISHAFI